MIGQKSFDIDAEEFLKGMSASDFVNDGGFSPVTQGTNVTQTPGLLYGTSPITDQTGVLTDDLVASCEDPTVAASAYVRLFVDNAGHFYTWDASTLSSVHTDGTNPTKYTEGRVDMIGFGNGGTGYVYVTNEVGIVEWIVGGAFNDTFYTFTGGTAPNVPHPALVYENNAFYGNGNVLLRQTAAGAAPADILTLSPSETIVALGIDPGTGKMLISIVDGLNASDTKNRIAKVGYYNGFSNKLDKSVIVDDMITAFQPVGGDLYITYGQNFGYWTGAGIQFLRKLSIQLLSTRLAYKQKVSNIGTTVVIVEGAKLLAYGDVMKGLPKAFYYIVTNMELGVEKNISAAAYLGSGIVGYGWANDAGVEKFYTIDTSSVSSVGASLRWRSNKYSFPRPVTFNQVVIEYGAALPTDNSTVGLIAVVDDKQQTQLLNNGISTTVANTYTVECPWPSIYSRSIQISYTFALQYPIKRFTVFYTPTE